MADNYSRIIYSVRFNRENGRRKIPEDNITVREKDKTFQPPK
ncbi:MAG: hypothetical protein WC071_08290 [Victivallaceae bacterium]